MSYYTEFGIVLRYFEENGETDVVVPDYAEAIGKMAFEEHSNLRSVIIPGNIFEIGSLAFHDCSNLIYVDIHEGTENICAEAFRECVKLKRIRLPRTLKYLGACAFCGCHSLSGIILPDELTGIGERTFLFCRQLAHVTLPKNLTFIGDKAFCACESLKSIEIPEGVTCIGEEAFSGSGLTRAVIPRSIEEIDKNAFSDIDNLVTNIPIADWRNRWGITKERYALNFMNAYTPGDPFFENLKEKNNRCIKEYLYDIELKFTPDDIKALLYLINEELLEVEDIEFFLEKMTGDAEITATLLDYKNAHFSAEYMEKWEQDRMEKALDITKFSRRDWEPIFNLAKNNGEYAVKKYRGSDNTVAVPGEIEGLPVTAIQPYAFSDLGNIQSVFIEEGVAQIGERAFTQCKRLAVITLPETLRRIGDNAFSECKSLTEITIPSKVTNIGVSAFCHCSRLAKVALPDKIKAIERFAFFEAAISEIVIPEGVETIKEYAFACCKNLSEITLPHSLKGIDEFAFADCHSLKKIVLHDNLCDISHSAFVGITELTIAAPAGSYAMNFALDNGYKFELMKGGE